MKAYKLVALGVPKDLIPLAGKTYQIMLKSGIDAAAASGLLEEIAISPEQYVDSPCFGEFASKIIEHQKSHPLYVERETPAPYNIWGSEGIDDASRKQMDSACRLPVAVRGALMPDAHSGYGLPIGGVLATRGAVIPFAVGMDIACRMKMSVFALGPDTIEAQKDLLSGILEKQTRFGVMCEWDPRQEHPVMDEDWNITKVTGGLKDRAWKQLGTSGSGNHFVEFGLVVVPTTGAINLAVLSHSGSRGTGAQVAKHYSKLAAESNPSLPDDLKHLAWLMLSSQEGQEYWNAMNLMGRYAAANHDIIHRHIAAALGAPPIYMIENHHNFAWEEEYDGEKLIIHRKGATPATLGVQGIIPGSMGTPAYIVEGRGVALSLNSASHGAGRKMSRTKAKETFTREEMQKFLADRGITLLSAGLDECPMTYKNIEDVMEAQKDLVKPIAIFYPKIVKMAAEGESED